jgi:hypothetical protein
MSPTAEPADKFKELIVYIARRLPPEAALGRVKLAKLLMKCDGSRRRLSAVRAANRKRYTLAA